MVSLHRLRYSGRQHIGLLALTTGRVYQSTGTTSNIRRALESFSGRREELELEAQRCLVASELASREKRRLAKLEAEKLRADSIKITVLNTSAAKEQLTGDTETTTSSVSAVNKNLQDWRKANSRTHFTKDMKISLDVLTTPAVDTAGTTVMLNLPNCRYVFGQIGEGTQRAWLENGVRLSRLSHFFLTGNVSWKNSGGLLGVILTMADVVTSRRKALEEQRQLKAEKKGSEGGGSGQVSVRAIYP